MATIGRRRAVVDIGELQLTGGVAYAVWGVVHIAYLTRWEDRLEAVWRWAVTLLGGRRRERLISIVSLVPETTARHVILELRRRRAERLDRAGDDRAGGQALAAGAADAVVVDEAAAVLVRRISGGPSGA